jgi:Na+/citrate or Na+/malate symporter
MIYSRKEKDKRLEGNGKMVKRKMEKNIRDSNKRKQTS